MNIFTSMRKSPLRRTPDGYLGGVCAGLAHRWNVAPIVVRIGAVILASLAGLGLIAYALAWLFLPKVTSEEIEFESAVGGDFSGSFILSVGLLALGLWMFVDRPFFVPFRVGSGFATVLVIVVLGITVAMWAMRRHGKDLPTPSVTAEAAPTAATQPEQETVLTEQIEQAPTGPDEVVSSYRESPSTASEGRKTRQRKASPAVSASYILVSFALAALAAAIVLLVMGPTLAAATVAAGAGAIVTGGAVMIAGITGRRGTWLTLVSVVASLALLPMVMLAGFLPQRVVTAPHVSLFSTSWAPNEVSIVTDRTYHARDLSDGDELSAGVGHMHIIVDPKDPVIFELHTVGEIQVPESGAWQAANGDLASVSMSHTSHVIDPQRGRRSATSGNLTFAPRNRLAMAITYSTPAAVEHPDQARKVKVELGFGQIDLEEKAASTPSLANEKK